MKHVLPLLIEAAREKRDREGAMLRAAQQATAQAANTLQRLGDFRGECLARSAAATQGQTTGRALQDYQRFVGRLDDAIGQQRNETARRADAADAQQLKLAQAQQRLLAFEALAQRRVNAQQQRDQRRMQRETDEFAARTLARGNPGASS
jgi:flagellar FliJ protein